MPEGVEIEIYRLASEHALDRVVATVEANDEWFCKEGTTPEALKATLTGATFTAARRRGKLLILDHDGGTLGLRFGMTGRIIVDGDAPIDTLEYSTDRNDPAWDRFVLHFDDGGALRLRDPRRLGGVVLDPDENALGPDVFSIKGAELDQRVFVGGVALKARMLDQTRVAGIGNLIADETLWRAGLDPARAAGSLDANDKRRFRRHLASVLADFVRDGGSHTGQLQPARQRGSTCPKDGAPLDRRTVGGRTTFSCPQHQR